MVQPHTCWRLKPTTLWLCSYKTPLRVPALLHRLSELRLPEGARCFADLYTDLVRLPLTALRRPGRTAREGRGGEKMAELGKSASRSRRPAGHPRPTTPTAAPPHPGPRASARGGGTKAHRRLADWLALREGPAVSRLDGPAGEPLARWRAAASGAGPAEGAIGWKVG